MILLFSELGKKLSSFRKNGFPAVLEVAINNSINCNSWFTRDSIEFAFDAWIDNLKYKKLEAWLSQYNLRYFDKKPAKVAVVMAGNIPLVGFHDFLCVLVSGHHFIGKCSSQDKFLLPAIANLMCELEPDIKNQFEFSSDRLMKFDAVIATGSDNTSRYFEYYFEKYPHIIRKNRNSIAILSGKESAEELSALADDVFIYFGLGCRNVTKLYVPVGYEFGELIKAFSKYEKILTNHNKFCNNYEYHKAMMLVNRVKHLDTGFCLIKEDAEIHSPISVLNYQYYQDIPSIMEGIKTTRNQIQCIVSSEKYTSDTVVFGRSQYPALWDYADGVDTMAFLAGL